MVRYTLPPRSIRDEPSPKICDSRWWPPSPPKPVSAVSSLSPLSTWDEQAPGTFLLHPPQTNKFPAASIDAVAASARRAERRRQQHEALHLSATTRRGGVTPRLLLFPSKRTDSADDDRMLDLSDKSLGTLPISYGPAAASLATLEAHRNRLASLPAELFLMYPSLQVLGLSANQLVELPDAVGEMASLLALDVSQNQLLALPESLGRLTALCSLNISCNQLRSLPSQLSACVELYELDAHSNQIEALPLEVGSLPALSVLDVSHNRLTELPSALLLDAPSLTDLRCRGNPLTEETERLLEEEGALFRFTDPDWVYASLRAEEGEPSGAAPVALVRASWLVERANAFRRAWDDSEERGDLLLPRRQEMPPEAFIYEEELRSLTPVGAYNRIAVIAISHCWASARHPDPEGTTLLQIGSILEERLSMRSHRNLGGYAFWPSEAGVFLDWCSLHQKDSKDQRSAEEERLFRRALANMTIWYAHQRCTTILLPHSGAEASKWESKDSGWGTFETSASRLFKVSVPFLWPGLVTEDEDEATSKCTQGYFPALAPQSFREVAKTKHFSEGARDLEAVCALYERDARAALQGVRELNFDDRHWGDEHFATMARCLTHCVRLRRLSLVRNKASDAAMRSLGEALGGASKLEYLNISGNRRVGAGGLRCIAAAAAAGGLSQLTCLLMDDLDLDGQKLDGFASALDGEGALPRLQKLSVKVNPRLGDAALLRLADVLKLGALQSLLVVDGTGCDFSEEGGRSIEAVRPAVRLVVAHEARGAVHEAPVERSEERRRRGLEYLEKRELQALTKATPRQYRKIWPVDMPSPINTVSTSSCESLASSLAKRRQLSAREREDRRSQQRGHDSRRSNGHASGRHSRRVSRKGATMECTVSKATAAVEQEAPRVERAEVQSSGAAGSCIPADCGGEQTTCAGAPAAGDGSCDSGNFPSSAASLEAESSPLQVSRFSTPSVNEEVSCGKAPSSAPSVDGEPRCDGAPSSSSGVDGETSCSRPRSSATGVDGEASCSRAPSSAPGIDGETSCERAPSCAPSVDSPGIESRCTSGKASEALASTDLGKVPSSQTGCVEKQASVPSVEATRSEDELQSTASASARSRYDEFARAVIDTILESEDGEEREREIEEFSESNEAPSKEHFLTMVAKPVFSPSTKRSNRSSSRFAELERENSMSMTDGDFLLKCIDCSSVLHLPPMNSVKELVDQRVKCGICFSVMKINGLAALQETENGEADDADNMLGESGVLCSARRSSSYAMEIPNDESVS
ncbi:hypothetical protein AB1Y20_019497 [Prymnesium parvum]|uniref:Leucine rich repeat protein n=1 Tax=Prymnesium parvum TaxID=97485 RepID=A0AB34JUA3_PRYPA